MTAERGNDDEAHKSSPTAEQRGSDDSQKGTSHEAAVSSPETHATVPKTSREDAAATSPSLSTEEAPPLPDEPPPDEGDDGWEAKWDHNANAWYFYNRRTGQSQWENPRIPEATTQLHGSYDRIHSSDAATLRTSSGAPGTSSPPQRRWGGYNPAIHGSYDPNADYAQEASKEEEEAEAAAVGNVPGVPGKEYTATAHFNRFTGKFQQAGMGPELHDDESKSKRQMTAFFDVDAAANSHDGRSLKAERRSKALSKKELKAFKEKRRDKKEEKRRAWLRD